MEEYVSDPYRSGEGWKVHFIGCFSKQPMCSAPCRQHKTGLDFSSLHIRSRCLPAVRRELIRDSQFWLQTQWVRHKQTAVSTHSCEWIKQHQPLSTPLISALSQRLHFARNLLTAFYCDVQYRRQKRIRFLPLNDPAAARRSTSIQLPPSLMKKYIMHHCNVRIFLSE